ncbi:MAG: ASKHA domain-containing protein [Desulfuromonas sp.]
MADYRHNAHRVMLALDLGTTTLGGRLVDATGQIVAQASIFNPQHTFGYDIIRRLEHATQPRGRRELQQALLHGITELFEVLLKDSALDAQAVARAVAAGNSAITLLARGADPAGLLRPPYRPDSCDGVSIAVDKLPVPLYLFPLAGGYVGGDLLAVLYGLGSPAAGSLVVDVGTNAEMALFDGARWLVTSVAAGPAFEGGNISCGMAAHRGAISGVHLEHERFRFDIIAAPEDSGAVAPRGLCGSAVVEALVAGLQSGLVGRDGTLADPDEVETNLARYLGVENGGSENRAQGQQTYLRLYRDADVDLRLSQEDIRQLQLAKGAVYAGAQCLVERAGVEPTAIEHVYITGALGAAIRPEMLKEISLLPEYMIKRVVFAPDGVLRGLVQFLQDEHGEMVLEKLREKITLYPLSGTPAFERAFVAALNF